LKGKCLISLTPAAKTTLVKAAQEDAVDEHTGESSLVIADDSDVEDEQPAPAAVVAPVKAQAPVVQAPAVQAPAAQAAAVVEAPAQAAAIKVVKKVVRTAKKE
jgi:CO dehydrogenase/acetyl-CoA synthase beta subunit